VIVTECEHLLSVSAVRLAHIADLVRVTASTGWPYPSEQIDRLWPFMVQSGDLPHLVSARRLLL